MELHQKPFAKQIRVRSVATQTKNNKVKSATTHAKTYKAKSNTTSTKNCKTKSSAPARAKRRVSGSLDARSQRSKNSIRRALQNGLAHRRMNLRIVEICRDAKITRPTFYNHCSSSDDALYKYELALRRKFSYRMTTRKREKRSIFTVLLYFVRDEGGYFTATMSNSDFYLLVRMLEKIQVMLVGSRISDITYKIYAQQLAALIQCWVIHEHFSLDRIPFYVDKLVGVRVMDYGIEAGMKKGY